MKKIKPLIPAALATLLVLAVSGCVVTPPTVRPAYVAPPGVVYVQPTYAAPAPGYVWEYHERYGWGWRHPQYGWHRGWH
ncbi:hypothetical protein PQR62_02770 [Herbaspirillum lusitanum]|uniref:YXWGXW repeat-containing protein n=1 Tax=Herbaspirillum lusitanum TaxID=213312 RepID=A0ABW9A4K6_9BURK